MATRNCEDLVQDELRDRVATLHDLWTADDHEAIHPEQETNIYEFGLSFDFVPPEPPQAEGYFRYQLSWGGSGDEFRFFAQRYGDYHFSVHRIEYTLAGRGRASKQNYRRRNCRPRGGLMTMINNRERYRGRVIKVNPLDGRIWIETDGSFIGYAKSVEDAKHIIDDLTDVHSDSPNIGVMRDRT